MGHGQTRARERSISFEFLLPLIDFDTQSKPLKKIKLAPDGPLPQEPFFTVFVDGYGPGA
jgi:hypothetical protein